MRISERAGGNAGLNAIALEKNRLAAAGAAVTDLSDSNPTRHGLLDPRVLEALARHAGDAARYRPQPRGPLAAREALAARFGGAPQDYWLTASTSQSYQWLFCLLADPGQAVATPAPGYPLVEPLARLSGLRINPYRLYYAHPHGWILDTASLAAAGEDGALRTMIVVNPGNPTGAYTAGTIDDVVDVCAAHGLALIADEVFSPFVMDGTARSIGGETRVATFTLGGLSKLLCAPQLKAAWIRLSGPAAELPALRRALDTVADLFLPVNGPVAAALPDLLALADDAVAVTRRRLQTNLAALHALLHDTAWRVRRCEGGWNAVVDVPPGVPGRDLALRLLRTDRLAVHPGWFYDLASDQALVLSLLPEPAAFLARLRRLHAAVEALAS